MRVFISWSKPRSRLVALALRDWLPKVIQAVKPWVSDKDLASGVSWFQEVGNRLNEASVGIICVTPENRSEPWLLFEAGAIAKSVTANANGRPVHCCPYVLGMKLTDLTGPLAQLQGRTADRDGTKALLQTINDALGPDSLDSHALNDIFDTWWVKLEPLLASIEHHDPENTKTERSERELLEEILGIVRETNRPRLPNIDALQAALKVNTEVMRILEAEFNENDERGMPSAYLIVDYITRMLALEIERHDAETQSFLRDTIDDVVRRHVRGARARKQSGSLLQNAQTSGVSERMLGDSDS